MTYNWIGLISAALAFLAFFGTYRRAMKLGIKPRLAWTAPILLLALPGASFAAYYTHLFPEPSWYYEFRSLRAAELFLVPLGAAGGLIASLLPRVALILPLLGVAAFTMTPFLKPIIGPLKSTTLTNVWIENVCIQSTASTCGPASSATILRQLGRETTEAELARDAYT